MMLPAIHGIIDRRILANYVADPKVVKQILPAPFRPMMHADMAIVGICLIRLKHIRPKGFPAFIGIRSENAAHRIAVEWDEGGKRNTGVYIPRRDTNLWLNRLVGGRLFPGKHHQSAFEVIEGNNKYSVSLKNTDGTSVRVSGTTGQAFPTGSVFKDLDTASEFFKLGSRGYSPNGHTLEGLELVTDTWNVKPLHVDDIFSSFFSNADFFPEGSIKFDNALLMTNIDHNWKSLESKPYVC